MSFLADLRLGDCVFVMGELEPESIDAIVCDPPYGLEFMGKEWDRLDVRQPDDETFHRSGVGPYDRAKVRHASAPSYGGSVGIAMQEWHEVWAREALRVLKPGGHLLAFGGTRTYHRLACALEDAGFEIRDCLAWLYGSGFPKSLDVAKAIDSKFGVQREVVGTRESYRPSSGAIRDAENFQDRSSGLVTAPASAEAKEWQGWGTALKPAHEPIVLARKPLVGTVAANVLEHGTGALNVDACRREPGEGVDRDGEESSERCYDDRGAVSFSMTPGPRGGDAMGRWPANVLLDEASAEMLDEQVGNLASGVPGVMRLGENTGAAYGAESRPPGTPMTGYGDAGGASRFFYCAKTSRAERNAGLEDFAKRPILWSSGEQNPGSFQSDGTEKEARNFHPTVKPIDLMRWLCRLVTPPGGLVLDPFMGSGTTGIAAGLEGFIFIGIERQADYLEIARARIAFWAEYGEDALTKMQAAESGKRRRDELEEAGQATFEWAPE